MLRYIQIHCQRTMNHVGFDDVKNNILDNGCHHQKGGKCKCMNIGFDDAKSIIKQECFNKHSRLSKQRLLQD